MKTTIVIPNYNGEKFLKNCIESVKLAKANRDCEILVVDNGSSDESLKQAKDYKAAGEIRLLELPINMGFPAAVNAGIKAAKTEYVFLLNNDTTVDEKVVSALEDFMDAHPKAFGVSAKMLQMYAPEKIDDCGDIYNCLGWARGLGKDKPKEMYEKNAKIFAPCAGAAIYRKEIFGKIGLFDERHFAYLEDIDVAYRALIFGYKNYFCKDAIVYHAGSGFSGSRYNTFKIELSSRNNVYLIHKNMPLLQWLINLPFLIVGFFVKELFFIRKGFGGTYFKGVLKGIKMSFDAEGRDAKVRFKPRFFLNYVKIQLLLWVNLVRTFVG
ncbi:MAG: glycosyltransferase family 2 protein [Lachnospiraceae bacterium]|nr:glycosyltransferase family 2 protein [Lachnospiraceae bacterium]